MVYRRRLLALLAPALACSFDGSGVITAGQAESSSGEVGSSSTSDGPPPTTTTTPDETTATPTTSGPTAPPTSDPTLATTATDDATTAPVDPTTGTGTDTTTGAPTCGDGLAEPPEACDAADLAGQTCADFGLVDGALACTPECTIDVTGCMQPRTCNNGALDPGEVCDGDDLGGATCESLGHVGGTLVCVDCVHDTSGCKDVPEDWYDEQFKRRRKLTVAKDSVAGAHTDFPLALQTEDMALVADLGDPDKLVFTTLDGAVLAHEIALAEADRLVAWVELKDLSSAADTEFWVYYGNPAASGTADGPATWSNKFLAVYHLDEPLVDEQEGGVHADATGKGHTGSQHDNQGNDTNCPVGRCQWFGPEDWIDLAKPQDFKLGNADITISVWVRPNDDVTRGAFIKGNPAGPELASVAIGLRNSGRASFEMNGAGTLDTNPDISNGMHHQIVWTQTKDDMMMLERWRLYVDGEEEAASLTLSLPSNDAHVARIAGKIMNTTFGASFEGAIDEVHVSTDDRSPEWVSTAYRNQRDPVGFTTWGPPESIP
ncbi:MAG: hypothetical protein JNL82_02475 [Myxococcales bacterium]|nr:hypothetical protein [Myxococcales bacterium]